MPELLALLNTGEGSLDRERAANLENTLREALEQEAATPIDDAFLKHIADSLRKYCQANEL
ncbi:MAG: hypothetical protein ACPG31_07460 [Planctomycetota bacterium]